MNERREPVLRNFYEELEIPYLASDLKVAVLLEKRKKFAMETRNKELYEKVELAREYLVERRNIYDAYLKRHGVKFPLTKKEKRKRLIIGTIITGVIIGIGAGSAAKIVSERRENLNSNVCVEYEIEQGDTKKQLQDKYGLKDISFEYMEVTGPYRQESAKISGVDVYEFLAAGDVIIGRTTKENANKLVNEKGAKIISIEEAVELLEQSGLNSLAGEFAKTAKGESNMVFYIPSNEKTLG